jgi:hypothetical protein
MVGRRRWRQPEDIVKIHEELSWRAMPATTAAPAGNHKIKQKPRRCRRHAGDDANNTSEHKSERWACSVQACNMYVLIPKGDLLKAELKKWSSISTVTQADMKIQVSCLLRWARQNLRWAWRWWWDLWRSDSKVQYIQCLACVYIKGLQTNLIASGREVNDDEQPQSTQWYGPAPPRWFASAGAQLSFPRVPCHELNIRTECPMHQVHSSRYSFSWDNMWCMHILCIQMIWQMHKNYMQKAYFWR